MKSIILSVKPQEAVNILNGKQTIIIKKSAPKETPFKVYLYCTKGEKGVIFKSRATNEIRLGFERDNSKEVIDILNKSGRQTLNGKVIAEFTCNKVEKMGRDTENGLVFSNGYNAESCLDLQTMIDYIGNNYYYGWHISDLKIYDEPKELDNFTGVCKSSKRCGESKICSSSQKCLYDKLTKPPATWMYVNIFKPN